MNGSFIGRGMVCLLMSCMTSVALSEPGVRLGALELLPAPAFDAQDRVADAGNWALSGVTAESLRNVAEILPSRRIAAATKPAPLRAASGHFDVRYELGGERFGVADFVRRTGTTGLLVLKGNRIVFEGYYQGADPQDQYVSFSAGKSFVSTLLGLAIGDGKIASVNDPVIRYLPEVKGSAYETARIRDVLQMASGTSYTEEYTDANSDIARYAEIMSQNHGGSYDFARSFKAVRPPGQQFYYASMDTEVIGALIARATGRSLSDYMSERLWKPIGAEAPARWILDQPGAAGREMAAGGLLVTLRDYGRFGLLFANGGRAGGRQLLPAGWVEEATRPQASFVDFGHLEAGNPLGYGYFWWCLPGPHHRFTAQGIHGQFVLVDPVEKLVVVKLSSWPDAWDEAQERETYAFFDAVSRATRGAHR